MTEFIPGLEPEYEFDDEGNYVGFSLVNSDTRIKTSKKDRKLK